MAWCPVGALVCFKLPLLAASLPARTLLVQCQAYQGQLRPRTTATAFRTRLQLIASKISLTKLAAKVHCRSSLARGLFTYHLFQDQAREQQSPEVLDGPQTLPQNYRQNGSWIVDHFSALGAQTTIQFWEQYLLDNQTSTLLSEVGNCLWEHSVEISPTVYWTRYLPEAFEASRGYPIFQWLPLIFHQSTLASYTGVQAGVTWYITDEEDSGNKHIGDYRQTLGELYGEYLSTYTAWAESLGLQFSAQVAYNIAQDMAQNIPKVNVPECESLASGTCCFFVPFYMQTTADLV